MTMVRELWACEKCGKYPIVKLVDTNNKSQILKEEPCPFCGGKTHFEKVREVEEESIVEKGPISLFEHCKRESGLTDVNQIKRYMNRHYGLF